MNILVRIRNFLVALAAVVPMVMSGGTALAANDSVATRAATVIASAEAYAAGIRAYSAKYGRVPAGGIYELVKEGFLKEYPQTTHSQSDFYSIPDLFDEGAGAAWYVRYSINDPDGANLCGAINEIKLKLRRDAAISATTVIGSPRVAGGLQFSPPPVEVVGKDAFCLKLENNYEYFLRIMAVKP